MIWEKNLAGIVLAAAISSNAHASSLPEKWTQWVDKHDPGTIYEQSEQLTVNTIPAFRQIVQKSWEEGIRDYVNLVQQSELEDAHLFIQSLELWIEVGYGEHIGVSEIKNKDGTYKSVSTLFLDREYISKIVRAFDNVTICHFHPEDPHGLQKERFYKQYVYNGLFSEDDVSSTTSLHKEINADFTGCVVSQFGVFLYKPKQYTDRVVKKYQTKIKEWDSIADAELKKTEHEQEVYNCMDRHLPDPKQSRKNPAVQPTEQGLYNVMAHCIGTLILETFKPIHTDFFSASFTKHSFTDHVWYRSHPYKK